MTWRRNNTRWARWLRKPALLLISWGLPLLWVRPELGRPQEPSLHESATSSITNWLNCKINSSSSMMRLLRRRRWFLMSMHRFRRVSSRLATHQTTTNSRSKLMFSRDNLTISSSRQRCLTRVKWLLNLRLMIRMRRTSTCVGTWLDASSTWTNKTISKTKKLLLCDFYTFNSLIKTSLMQSSLPRAWR